MRKFEGLGSCADTGHGVTVVKEFTDKVKKFYLRAGKGFFFFKKALCY
jgi:hypothetical protein